MLNFEMAEILVEDRPNKYWKMLNQIGVKKAIGVLPRHPTDWRMQIETEPWNYFSLSKYKNMLNDNGFELIGIEDNPPMNNIKFGLKNKDDELDYVAKLIENMGKLNIKLWCYNWSAGIGWSRTSTHINTEFGQVSGFNIKDIENAELYPVKITSNELWKNLKDFLDYIVPLAEDNDVKLAMHPDDPPLDDFLGIPRIMNSVNSFDKLLEIKKSDYNGITFCQGNFALMTDDLPDVIKHFNKKIFFVHFRDVIGDKYNFIETLVGHGKTNLFEVMKAYNEINFDGIMRVDHVPTLEGDYTPLEIAWGYSYLDRLYTIGYIDGLKSLFKMVY
jgi:mannonate dehydratase